MLTNSWSLYQDLHEIRGPGVSSATEYGPRSLGERIRASGYWSKWATGLCTAVGTAILNWISLSKIEREAEEQEGHLALKALTRQEQEFRKHCEEGHVVFRKDCRACLQGQMRSHMHRRQKHHGSNTFCLSMDLVGPWKPGKDHLLGQPATRFLIASLTVPKPGSMEEEKGDDDLRDAEESREPEESRGVGSLMDYEAGGDPDGEVEAEPSPEEMERGRRQTKPGLRKQHAFRTQWPHMISSVVNPCALRNLLKFLGVFSGSGLESSG